MSWLARILGRRYKASTPTAHFDSPLAVSRYTFRTGILQAHILQPSYSTAVTSMRTTWFMHLGGSTSAPKIMKHIEVCNPTVGAITFRMAIMSVSDGTPGTSNAFLAWDTSLAACGVWTWEGEVPLSGRYFYARAASPGLTLLVTWHPATA